MIFKDEMLNCITEKGGNVAQFVSFAPDGSQRYMRIRGVLPNYHFDNIGEAVAAILRTGVSYINIRSFLPDKPDGNPFFMGRQGLETVEKISCKVQELLSQGFYIIVNEEVDINDGGFSGVLLGNVAEFATRDVPRCVEKPDCAVLPRLKMLDFARVIYGHRINIPYERRYRVEFSVHPGPVGYGKEYQIIWQIESTERGQEIPEPKLFWPNRVSKDIGDKGYGLLMAHLYNFLVPRTKVVGRVIPPFEFGETTGSPEPCWRRTCPIIQQPGLFTTKHGQIDPFALMQKEDPDGSRIAAILFQDNVDSVYSGAAITDAAGGVIIEGIAGHGDEFMIGKNAPETNLPEHVKDAVKNIWEKACIVFERPVRFEWCYDKTGTVWIVQFHIEQSSSIGNVIYPGEPQRFVVFKIEAGLEKLRVLAQQAKEEQFGVILEGRVGITSHFGDILRRYQIPSRIHQ